MTTMSDLSSTCPLCQSTRYKNIENAQLRELLDKTESYLNIKFSNDVRNAYNKNTIALNECLNCGLQYFWGGVSGSNQYYSDLTSNPKTYYNESKWDFTKSLDIINPADHVLDIACGSGYFLSTAISHGISITGIDTNSSAIKSARNKGLDAQCIPLKEFGISNHENYDIINYFR